MHGLRVDLRMARLDERAVLPVRATSASAGMDLHALERAGKLDVLLAEA